MRNLIPSKVKYFKSYANDKFKHMMQLRYGINSNTEGVDPTSSDLDWMRYQLIGWQENEDHGALTRTAIQYTTWLQVDYQGDEAALNPGCGYHHHAGHLHNGHVYGPSSLGVSYVHSNGSQNIIEVNAGGCLTRINLNPAITINNNTGFTFTQDMPAEIWTIAHNLNYIPNVFTTDLNGIEMEGVVDPIDNNTIQITFSEAVSGYAYLS